MVATLKAASEASALESSPEAKRRAAIEYLAQKVAARLYQRFMRANPTKEFLTLATPIIAHGILEGRADVMEETSRAITDAAKEIAQLKQMNAHQAATILALTRLRKQMSEPGSEGA
jgi:hypothetical protein